MRIDHTYIINLNRHHQRRRRMIGVMDESGLGTLAPYTFFDGVEGRDIKKDFPMWRYSYGSLGCTMSHISVLRDAVQMGYKHILVLEDDIIPRKGLAEYIERTVAELPEHHRLVYLGATQLSWTGIETTSDAFYRARDTYGAFAYIVDTSLLPTIEDLFGQHMKPIDELFPFIQATEECHVCFPNLVIANLNESTTRPRNHWSMAIMKKRLRWTLCDYQF